MKISLLFLCMIALAGISFAGDCTPALTITDVKYEGTQKISTLGGLQDLVLVKGQFNTLNTCLVPAKIRVDVTVTRKNGHVDTGFNEVPVATMGQTPQFSAIINRGALETDPVSFQATMKVTAWTVKIHPSTVKQNNGQTLSQVDQTLACAPKINVATMLNIVPSTALNSDTVKVNWSQELGAPASCVNITGTNIQVKTIHVDNNFICSGSHVASAGANQDTVKASCNPEPIGNPGGVNRIETTLSPLLTAGSVNLSASKSGNF